MARLRYQVAFGEEEDVAPSRTRASSHSSAADSGANNLIRLSRMRRARKLMLTRTSGLVATTNDTLENKAANQRIEIVVVPDLRHFLAAEKRVQGV